jgi:hypothetical protein
VEVEVPVMLEVKDRGGRCLVKDGKEMGMLLRTIRRMVGGNDRGERAICIAHVNREG